MNCQKCGKPRHEKIETAPGEPEIILCDEADRDSVAMSDQWNCGCCRCADGLIDWNISPVIETDVVIFDLRHWKN